MNNRGIIALLAWLPATAAAQPVVEIVSPTQGTCVANQNPFFGGGIFGGEAQPPRGDVRLELRLMEAQGRPIRLQFFVDGVPVDEAQFVPAQAGVPEVTEAFAIGDFFIDDGQDRTVRVVASVEAQSAEDSVTFDLDRLPPRLVASPDDVDLLDGCHEVPPNVPYDVVDEVDPNPVEETRTEQSGCFAERIVTLRDDCGNAAEYRARTLRPAPQGAIDLQLQGYRCALHTCITEGPDAVQFAEGASVGRATAVLRIAAEDGCLESVGASYTVDGGPPQVLIPGDIFEQPGAYVVTARASSCGGANPVSRSLRFTVVDAPTADIGGPYDTAQGQPLMLDASGSMADAVFGGIAEYAWDLNDDRFYELRGPDLARVPFDTSRDGEFRVRLRITAGNGGFAGAETVVNVRDVHPTCALVPFYQGVQGEPIEFDASESAPGHPTDPIVAYDWDFGDGVFPQRGDDLARPNHIYGSPGEYTVRLRVEDPDSSAECEASVMVEGGAPQIIGLSAINANNLVEGDEVCFSAGETRPANAFDPIINFEWDYGDGSLLDNGPVLRGPCHRYTDSGDFEVCLRVQDQDGDQDRACIDIHVRDVNPRCELMGPLFANEGATLTFDASRSSGNPAIDPLTGFTWNFGDGSPEVQRPANQPTVEHVFQDQGQYVVTVAVHDEDSSTECTHEILINDVVPTARLAVVYPGDRGEADEGQTITLDASASRPGAPTDPIIAYRWDFGDGTTRETQEPTVQYAWGDQGVYAVRVTVVDDDGSAISANATVNVVNVAPRLRIEAPEGNQVEIGVEAEFVLVVEDVPADLPPPTIVWTMGDGSAPIQGVQTVRHTYNALGERVIRVSADDGDGGTAEATLRIEVTPAAPRLERLDPISTCEGQTVRFRMRVDAALRNGQGGYDGPVVIGVRGPDTAPAAVITPDAENPNQTSYVDFEWTPTYYDAGRHEVRVTGVGPFSGISRTRNVIIDVCEAGSPLLAAMGGTSSRGLVTLFDYTRQGGRISFQPRAEVEVGLGAADLAVDPAGQRVYVAVPGSGGVAVVQVVGEARRLRLIPTGSQTSAVAVGGGKIWAVNAGDDTLVRIDPTTLKVERRVNLGAVQRVLDIAWLPAGFAGLDGPRIALVAARSGHIALVDPAAVEASEDGVLVSRRIGGTLTHLAADPGTGWLTVVDAKARRAYRLDAGELEENPQGVQVESVSLPFAARDLLADDDAVLIATDAGIWSWAPDGEFVRPGSNQIQATALADLPVAILPGGGFIGAVGDRVEHYGPAFDRQIGAAGTRIRRLAAFVARQ